MVTNVSRCCMFDSLEAAKPDSSDFNQMSVDGGSSANGSVQEFEVVARDKGRSNSQDFLCALPTKMNVQEDIPPEPSSLWIIPTQSLVATLTRITRSRYASTALHLESKLIKAYRTPNHVRSLVSSQTLPNSYQVARYVISLFDAVCNFTSQQLTLFFMISMLGST